MAGTRAVFIICFFLVLQVSTPATALAAEWRIARVTGEVYVATLFKKVPAEAGMLLKPGHKVETGQRGRCIIARQKERIIIGPNSVMTAPAVDNGRTLIFLRSGSAIFDVEKRNHRHFKVHTRTIAGVVKGTRFAIRSSRTGDVISTQRGLVAASQIGSSVEIDLPPGWKAYRKSGSGQQMMVADPRGRVMTAAQAAAAAEAKSQSGPSESSDAGRDIDTGRPAQPEPAPQQPSGPSRL